MPKPVNQHHRDEPVGGVPVKAPHNASQVPLNAGYPLDRGVGLGRAYAVEYEKIKARKEYYPEKKHHYRGNNDKLKEHAKNERVVEDIPSARLVVLVTKIFYLLD